MRLLWSWWYLTHQVLSVKIRCRDKLTLTLYVTQDTERSFFLFFFIRHTDWLKWKDRTFYTCIICTKFYIQIHPPFSMQSKWYFWKSWISHYNIFTRKWIYTYLCGTCEGIYTSNDKETCYQDKEGVLLTGIILLTVFHVDFNVKPENFLFQIKVRRKSAKNC